MFGSVAIGTKAQKVVYGCLMPLVHILERDGVVHVKYRFGDPGRIDCIPISRTMFAGQTTTMSGANLRPLGGGSLAAAPALGPQMGGHGRDGCHKGIELDALGQEPGGFAEGNRNELDRRAHLAFTPLDQRAFNRAQEHAMWPHTIEQLISQQRGARMKQRMEVPGLEVCQIGRLDACCECRKRSGWLGHRHPQRDGGPIRNARDRFFGAPDFRPVYVQRRAHTTRIIARSLEAPTAATGLAAVVIPELWSLARSLDRGTQVGQDSVRIEGALLAIWNLAAAQENFRLGFKPLLHAMVQASISSRNASKKAAILQVFDPATSGSS